MPEEISVRLGVQSTRIRAELEGIVRSVSGFGLQNAGGSVPSDILILEIGENPDREFQAIHSLQASGAVRAVFVTSSRLEHGLLIQAMRTGVREFFSQPLKPEEVRQALAKFKESMKEGPRVPHKQKEGKIIDVMGSKGGVGTTTVAVNLATTLQKSSGRSASVALIDMNLLFGEIPVFLNIDSHFNWAEVARNISRLDSTYLMSILTRHESGICVLPSPGGLDGVNVTTPEIIETILAMMKKHFDFVIIDMGQSLDDISLKIMEMSDLVFLVSILSLPCLTNVKKLLWTFRSLGYPPEEDVKIIVNRFHKKSLISLKEAEEVLKQKIFSLISNDYATTMSAINQGKPIEAIDRSADIVKDFSQLGKQVLQARRN